LLKVTRDSLGPLLETWCKFRSRAAREQKEGILSVDKIPSFLPCADEKDAGLQEFCSKGCDILIDNRKFSSQGPAT